jgi:AcrR family transcriptional regulator
MTNRRSSSRNALLDAAEMVVLAVGAGHLTLDAVADKAGVSKGGLIYHFPSKEALLEAMMTRLLARFNERQAKAAESLPPGVRRELQAYVAASLTDPEETKRLSAAILAVVANNPRLLAPVQEYFRQWFAGLPDSGLGFGRAAVISLAVDGLWLLEMLQLSPLDRRRREEVAQELFRLADGND